MKDTTFETKIVAANPFNRRSAFVKATMKQIRRAQPAKKRSWFATYVHKPSFALIAVIAAVVCSGAVYATVTFTPRLIELLDKKVNDRGATEYTVSGFAACADQYRPIPKHFEIKKNVALSDDEVHKIIQAKCELNWTRDFAAKKWPQDRITHDQRETITFTQVDLPGTIEEASTDNIRVTFSTGTVDIRPMPGASVAVFADGEEVPASQLKPGDIVLRAQRIRHSYPDFSALPSQGESRSLKGEQPADLGTVALFKLSLPPDYYVEKQWYLTEIPACQGNPEELCPNTPAIDIYPRVEGGPGANPDVVYNPDNTFRDISGTVTELHADRLTLKSRAGNIYTVAIGSPGFAIYNRDFADNYLPDDTTLKVGSIVAVYYTQPANANPKTITKDQVVMVTLQLEAINPKSDPLKGY